MSPESFICKTFGGLLLLGAIPFLYQFFSSSIHSGDVVDMVLMGGAALLCIGGAVGFFYASTYQPPKVQAKRSAPPATRAKPSPAAGNPVTLLIALGVLLAAIGLGLLVTSGSHGDTAADRSGIAMLWWAGKTVGIIFVVYTVAFVAQKLSRKSDSTENQRRS